MSWLIRLSQLRDLNQMLTEVAQGIGDIGVAANYLQSISPAGDEVCQQINTIGQMYQAQGMDGAMRRLAQAAGCDYNPPMEEEVEQPMLSMPGGADKAMDMPSIEFE